MHPIPKPVLSTAARRFMRTALVTSSFVLAAHSAFAASTSWSFAGGGDWVTDSNWTSGSAPGGVGTTSSADTATFGSTSTLRTITVDATRNVAGITFTGTSTSGYTLTGGSLWLTSGGTIQNSGAGSNHTDRIDSQLVIQGDGGSYTINATATSGSTNLAIGSGGITGVSTLGNTTTLTLGGANTSAGNSITGVIGDGSGGGKIAVSKTGGGSWNLGGANTFSGGFTLGAGNVRISNNAAFGTGILTINGGALSGSATATIANNMVWGATVSHNNSIGNSGSITMNGTALLTGNRDVSVTAAASSLTVNGVISDGGNSFGITKTGNYALTLGGANTYTGTTNVNAGTVTMGAAGSLNSGSTLAVNAGASAGTAGGRVNLNGRSFTVAALAGTTGLGGQGVIANNSVTASTLTVNNTSNSTYNGLLIESAGSLALVKSGAGALTLTGSHSYAGGTTVSGGTLFVNGGVTTAAAQTGLTSGVITGSAGGNFTMTGVSTANLVVGQRISGTNIAAGSYITSINGSTITVSAYSTTGNTASDGEAFAAYNGSGLGTGAVTVSGGTLGGTGAIAGATTIQAGGTLATGVNGVGTLTFNSNLTLAGTTLLEIASASSYDIAAVGGALNYGGTLTLSLLNGFTFSGGETYNLLTSTTHTGSFTSISVAGTTLDAGNGYTSTIGGLTYTFTTTDSAGMLSVSAIPEPSTYAAILGSLALAGMVVYRRRSR
ncbi:MAG: putative autotransporter protein [Rariglobus sp.]|jgi:autotransporter-associated beta strand protein|nr:putative autotransporter protein [Rariglobus sp.]